MRDQGKLFKAHDPAKDGASYFVLPMLHPAAALRATSVMNMFEETFKKLPVALDKIKTPTQSEESPRTARSEKAKKLEDVQGSLF